MPKLCTACESRIEPNEEWEELPNGEAIHEDCIDKTISRGVVSEGGQATTNSRSVSRDFGV